MGVVSMTQRMNALERANEIRCANAEYRQQAMRLPRLESRQFVAGLLESPPATVLSMPIGRLLLSAKRAGKKHVSVWLNLAEVRSFDRRVGDLTERQRDLLASELRR